MDLAALVEKVGRCQVYWQKHCDQWSNAEWLQRRKQLNELSVAMGAGLEAAGKRIEDFGMEVVASRPEQFDAFIAAEMRRWARVVKEAKIEPE